MSVGHRRLAARASYGRSSCKRPRRGITSRARRDREARMPDYSNILGRAPFANLGQGYGMQARNQLQQANQAGFFNPLGSPQINAAVRRNALRTGDNARRRSAILSRLMGLDAKQARVAQVNADTEANQAQSDALNQSYLQQLLGNQNYFRDLFGSQLGFENQRALAQYQQNLQNRGGLGGAF